MAWHPRGSKRLWQFGCHAFTRLRGLRLLENHGCSGTEQTNCVRDLGQAARGRGPESGHERYSGPDSRPDFTQEVRAVQRWTNILLFSALNLTAAAQPARADGGNQINPDTTFPWWNGP